MPPSSDRDLKKAQAQSVSQLQHLEVPSALSRAPGSRRGSGFSASTLAMIAVISVSVAVAAFFLVRAMN